MLNRSRTPKSPKRSKLALRTAVKAGSKAGGKDEKVARFTVELYCEEMFFETLSAS